MRTPDPREGAWDAATAEALLPFARRYVGWKSPAEAVAQPGRLIAQVMNMGDDHRDVEAIATLVAILAAGGDLAAGLAGASAMFGPNLQPAESLRALVFFRDGDLESLSESDQRSLVAAATTVRDLPEIRIRSRTLSALGRERGR